MMIGSPGTGKSMLAKAMSQLLPKEDLQDVLVYHNPDDGNEPKVRTVPAGKGEQIIEAHKEEARKRNQMRSFLMWVIIAIVVGYALLLASKPLLGILAAGVIYLAFRYGSRGTDAMIPNLLVNNSDVTSAPFEDATGAHAGALLGDVRHDPFQSGGMETPSHDRVEPGAIHKANKGVLFVDEINTLDIRSQQKLMTAIQEGEFSITGQSERSSGAMVHTEPVPTDFVMVAAGNLDAMENMHPALRSRIKGYGYEVYMDDTIDDTPEMRRKYARFVATRRSKRTVGSRTSRIRQSRRSSSKPSAVRCGRTTSRSNCVTSVASFVLQATSLARRTPRTPRATTSCRRNSARAPSSNGSPTTTSNAGRTTNSRSRRATWSAASTVWPSWARNRYCASCPSWLKSRRRRVPARSSPPGNWGAGAGSGPERQRHHQEVQRRGHLGEGHPHPVRPGVRGCPR